MLYAGLFNQSNTGLDLGVGRASLQRSQPATYASRPFRGWLRQGSRAEGHGKGKRRARPRFAIDPQTAAEVIDDLPADGKTESRALRFPGFCAAHLAILLEDDLL